MLHSGFYGTSKAKGHSKITFSVVHMSSYGQVQIDTLFYWIICIHSTLQAIINTENIWLTLKIFYPKIKMGPKLPATLKRQERFSFGIIALLITLRNRCR